MAAAGPGVVVPVAAAIGLVTGLLANGGGFLLVPLSVLAVIAVPSIPTVATHWALGHIDWAVAAGSPPAASPAPASDRCSPTEFPPKP